MSGSNIVSDEALRDRAAWQILLGGTVEDLVGLDDGRLPVLLARFDIRPPERSRARARGWSAPAPDTG
jgi:hypothetical protein